ncbi:metal-sulfur cluster assembly factor [Bifidobacterium coryneforme]|nr:metal-sulfur cluster assembly factor [Bifidobacterium indicum]
MSSSDNLVPEPQDSILASVNRAIDDEGKARALAQNPTQAESIMGMGTRSDPAPVRSTVGSQKEADQPKDKAESSHGEESADPDDQVAEEPGGETSAIPLKAVDDIGRATAQDVREALHQVIDPELGIDVVDLGLVYGIEIDELGRAIFTMTLTTPACPLTDLIEDQCASVLAGLVEEFRIDWTWTPRWSLDMITPDGREQLAAIGFNFENMPTYD